MKYYSSGDQNDRVYATDSEGNSGIVPPIGTLPPSGITPPIGMLPPSGITPPIGTLPPSGITPPIGTLPPSGIVPPIGNVPPESVIAPCMEKVTFALVDDGERFWMYPTHITDERNLSGYRWNEQAGWFLYDFPLSSLRQFICFQ